ARDQKEIAEEPRQDVRLLEDALERLGRIRGALVAGAQRDLRFAADDRDRHAQLVTRIGEERPATLILGREGRVRALELGSSLGDRALEAGAMCLQRLLLVGELLRHRVEDRRELCELIPPAEANAVRELAGA